MTTLDVPAARWSDDMPPVLLWTVAASGATKAGGRWWTVHTADLRTVRVTVAAAMATTDGAVAAIDRAVASRQAWPGRAPT